MYNFILQFLIMASLAVLIYLVARTIPRIDENIILTAPKNSFFDKLVSKVPLEKIDLMFDNLLEKILRKFKIVIMKFDNVLTKWLSGFKSSVSNEKNIRPNIFNASDSANINNRPEDKKE